jgi:hypothetical protein
LLLLAACRDNATSPVDTTLPADSAVAAAPAPLVSEEQEVEPEVQTSDASARVSPQWLVGSWSEDGFCEGDAGETYLADQTWGDWGTEGHWSLTGDRLVVTKTMRVRDTLSEEPEPLTPAELVAGTISNATAKSYDLTVEGRTIHMGRC